MPLHPLDDTHERRFGGIDRLYGEGARIALHRGRVAVVGVGGVGSWAVEALARSGVGNLTLIDFDQIAVSNVNRQIQALDSTLGEAKVLALQARIRDINPACRVHAIEDFLTLENLPQLIAPGAFDAVIDACDEARVRNLLRKEHRLLPRKNGKFGAVCVYLEQPARKGTSCTTGDLSCAGYGSAVTVTAAMGFAAAALCLERITIRQED